MADTTNDESEVVVLKSRYVGAEDVPILLATDFLIQFHKGMFILNVAQGALPTFIGSPEEMMEQAKELTAREGFVPIHVRARVGMNEDGLRALVRILQGHLERFGTPQPEGSQEEEGE